MLHVKNQTIRRRAWRKQPDTLPLEEIRKRLEENISMLPCEPGCWLWTGATILLPSGYEYPVLSIKEDGKWKCKRASRLSFRCYRGPLPDELDVCHTCDTPLCIRPDHFFLGTQLDNARDSWRKGRHAWNNGTPRVMQKYTLTEEQRQQIFILLKQGMSHGKVAMRFGVTRGATYYILESRGNNERSDCSDV